MVVHALCIALEQEPAPFDPVGYATFCLAILGLHFLGILVIDATESWGGELYWNDQISETDIYHRSAYNCRQTMKNSA